MSHLQKLMLEAAHLIFRGEKCKGCGQAFDSPSSMSKIVWWPWEGGRIGHEECYLKSLSSKTEDVSKP